MPLSNAVKRLIDQSGPGLPRKRARMSTSTTVVLRGKKDEMKYFDTTISHSVVNSSVSLVSDIAQGTSVSDRVGNKIKIFAIEYFVTSTGATPIRVEFLRLKNPATLPTHAFNTLALPSAFDRLKTLTLHDGTLLNRAGCYGVHRLKMGNVVHFISNAGNSVTRNRLVAYITTPSNQTVTGQFRVWYTDG